ncbi:T6SS immunity protein Tli4 family protein [Cupriavidus sp. JZ107]
MRQGIVRSLIPAAALACSPLAFGQAAVASGQWLPECVGRLELQLPGPADQAAWDPVEVAKRIRGDLRRDPPARYPDGERAFHVNLGDRGPLLITHPMSDSQRGVIRAAVDSRMTKDGAMLKARDGNDVYGTRATFDNLDWAGPGGKAWRVGSQLSAFTTVSDSGLWWKLSTHDSDAKADEEAFASLVAGAMPRVPNTVPPKRGLCMPYVFLPDDGVAPRYVAASYRLKGQPDVIIGLEDKSAAPPNAKLNARMRDPEGVSDFFWTHLYQNRREVTSIWRDRYRRTTIAGVKALESFVRLRREDGTVDHGYLVVALGSPHAQGSSSVTLHVIQRSDFARKAGITPLDEASFLALARGIAAKVTPRVARDAR